MKLSPGFLTLEILLCLAIGTAAVAGALALVFVGQEVLIDAQNHRVALESVSKASKQAMAGSFAEQENFVLLSDYAKFVKSESAWQNNGLVKTVSLQAVVIDWQNGLGRDTCALAFNQDWSHPVLKGSLSLGPDNPATAVDADFNKVYLTTNSPAASKEDFFIINVSDPLSPQKISGLNTGPGLTAVKVAGDYAFVANTSVNSQLQIIKISDSAHPAVMLNIKLPLGNDGLGSSIYFYNKKLFVGVTKSAGPELYVYNVENPLAPVLLGAYETSTAVNAIYAYGNFAYLSLAQGKLLTVLNISDPGHITEVSSFTPTGSNVQSAQALAVLGSNAILGRAGGLPDLGYKELYWLTVSTSTQPTINFELDTNASIHGLFLRDKLIFTALRQTGSEFKVFLLSAGLPQLSALSLPANPTSLDCEFQNIYLTLESEPQLQIIQPN